MPHYTLTFGRSSSPHYAEATALAAQIPGTTVTGGDGVDRYAVPLDAESLPALGALLELVVGWKRTALWRDGRRLPAGTLTHLRTVLACWRERETSGLGALRTVRVGGMVGGAPCRPVWRRCHLGTRPWPRCRWWSA